MPIFGLWDIKVLALVHFNLKRKKWKDAGFRRHMQSTACIQLTAVIACAMQLVKKFQYAPNTNTQSA